MGILDSIYKRLPPHTRYQIVKFLTVLGYRPQRNSFHIFRRLSAHSPIETVVHLGAHYGQEQRLYEKLGAKLVVWVEADPVIAQKLRRVVAGGEVRTIVLEGAVSDVAGAPLTLLRYTNDGGSNSLHEPGDRWSELFGEVRPTGERIVVKSITLDDIISKTSLDNDFTGSALLVLDIQGHEEAALQGCSQENLDRFDLVLIEISTEAWYRGGATLKSLLSHMKERGWTNNYSTLAGRHGDTLFEKHQHS